MPAYSGNIPIFIIPMCSRNTVRIMNVEEVQSTLRQQEIPESEHAAVYREMGKAFCEFQRGAVPSSFFHGFLDEARLHYPER